MKIIVVSDYERMSEEVAKIVQAQIAVKPDSVLGLATGSTPLGTYRKLVEMAKDGLDFSQVTTFNLDEYVGLAGDHPQSYRYYMEQNLFSGVNIPRKKPLFPTEQPPIWQLNALPMRRRSKGQAVLTCSFWA